MAPDHDPPPLAADLEMVDRLLQTLTDVLDIREVFHRVSEITREVLPHDLLGVVEVTEDGDRIRLHATNWDGIEKFEIQIADPGLLTKPWDLLLIDDLPAHPLYGDSPAAKRGMMSALCVPVRYGGRLRAGVNFFSRARARFSPGDLPVAKRIAGYVALAMSHHRLAEEARARQELEARAAMLAMLDQSLASVADGGDLRELFDRVSAIAQQVLPHDAMALPVLEPDGLHARRYATSGLNVASIPDLMEVPPGFVRDPGWEHDLIDDVTTRSEPLNRLVATLGMRSILRVPVRLGGRFVAVLAFMSKTPAFFVPGQVQIARRIGDRLALGLEHERGFEAGQRADAANERAARLEARVRALTEELDARTGARRVIGDSASWRAVLTQAAQVASTDTTVLLLGETGTGKEVVARFLHRASKRSGEPFVALNCAALPEHLLESELFGFERGAFTGAVQSKPGLIEQAAGGVLFLDEAGEMSPSVQAKFLRVLQEREFQRLGGTRVLRADLRVIAATNRDLRASMERGAFRDDLYYRLSVFEIRIPPLRERRDDILPLSVAFLDELGRALGRPPSGISRDARQALVAYDWPGNVRELRNMLERAAILADGGLIAREHLTLPPQSPAIPSAPPPAEAPDLPSVERTMIEKALRDARYNKSQAAKSLGLTRAQLYVRLKRHGLD